MENFYLYSQIILTLSLFLTASLATKATQQEETTERSIRPKFMSIGTMSGTSMDGVEVALLQTDGAYYIRDLGNTSLDYEKSFHLLLKSAEYAVCKYKGDIEEVSQKDYSFLFTEYITQVLGKNEKDAYNIWLETAKYLIKEQPNLEPSRISLRDIINHSTEIHAKAIKRLLLKVGYSSQQIDVVGYYGQTLYHKPKERITVQVGDGEKLAKITGISVVNDFRSRDIKEGGQGAPFAPLYHQALAIRDNLFPIAVVNCGGISNITLIKGPNNEDLLGFDTGPGNGLVDLFVKRRTSLEETMDKDGKYGSQGKVNASVLELLRSNSIRREREENYLGKKPPKSLDINDLTLIDALSSLTLEDGCRTLEAFTAECIVESLDLIPSSYPKPSYWVLAGGGWNNPVIKQELKERLENKYQQESSSLPLPTVKLAEDIGWNNKAMEAQIFAYLAVRSLLKEPISIPQTTGVPYPLTGGNIYLSPKPTTLMKQVVNRL
jgi:anhydro-N-acetylmuramic acid kinase